MKQGQKRMLVCLLAAMLLLSGCRNAGGHLAAAFSQPQWQSFDFAEGTAAPDSVAPYKPGNEEQVLAACREGGIKDPILPTAESLPSDARLYQQVFPKREAEGDWYDLRFYAFSDRKDPQLVYSAWIAAVPYEGNYPSDKMLFFPPNADPAEIEAAVILYAEVNQPCGAFEWVSERPCPGSPSKI